MTQNLFFDKKQLKYCGSNVIIGKTVRIRRPEECIIEDNVIIDDFAYISAAIHIKKYCHIASHVAISGGQGNFFMDEFSTLSSHVSVHCASSDYNKISLDLPSVPKEMQFGGYIKDVKVGKYVTVGSHSVLLPGVSLPDKFACGAFTLLTEQVYEPSSLYVGIPARFLKKRVDE